MTFSETVVAIAALYLGACLLIGMWPSRRASDSATGYVAGDRSLGLFVMYFITGATIFSAFAFLGMPGWAYSRGVAAFYVIGYGVFGFLPFYFLGPRAARLGRAHGFVTQAEMVAYRFTTPKLAGLMALISALAFVPYLALQMKGAGYVLHAMTDGALAEWQGAAIVYAVVATYVLKSGVLGVGWTNTFQGIFMMVLAWTLGIYLPTKLYGGVGPMFERIASERPELLAPPGLTGAGTAWSWSEYSSAVLVSTIGFSMWPHVFMRAFSARSDETLRRTVILYPTFQLFLVPILILGFAGVLFASAPGKADEVLPHLLMHAELPAVVVGLFCAGALAASMSSGDAMLHATASILVRDGWITAFGRQMEPRTERAWIRVWILIVVVASYATAILYEDDLVNLLLYAYGPVTQFAPVVVATLCWSRATPAGAVAGLLSGTAVNLTLHIAPQLRPFPLHAGLYGLAINTVMLIVVSLRSTPTADSREFLEVARGERRTR